METTSNPIFAFECNVSGRAWQTIVHARTAGKAKAEFWRNVTEPWPDIPFTAIRARKLGAPQTSAQFLHNAQYRGLPDLRCGDRIHVGANAGTVVGHDYSANFRVLFDDNSLYPGQTLSVHPSDIRVN